MQLLDAHVLLPIHQSLIPDPLSISCKRQLLTYPTICDRTNVLLDIDQNILSIKLYEPTLN